MSKEKLKLTALKATLYTLLIFAIYEALGIVLQMVSHIFMSNSYLTSLICNIVVILIIFAIIVRLPKASNDPNFPHQYKQKKLNAKAITLIAVFAFVFLAFVNRLIILVMPHIKSGHVAQQNEKIAIAGMLITFFFSAIAAPLWEEMLIRGLFFRGLRSRFGFWGAAVIVSLFWGIIHFSIVQFVVAFLTSIGFCMLYEVYRKLLVTIVIHVANNVISILGLGPMLGIDNYIIYLFVTIVEFIIALYLFMRIKGRRIY